MATFNVQHVILAIFLLAFSLLVLGNSSALLLNTVWGRTMLIAFTILATKYNVAFGLLTIVAIIVLYNTTDSTSVEGLATMTPPSTVVTATTPTATSTTATATSLLNKDKLASVSSTKPVTPASTVATSTVTTNDVHSTVPTTGTPPTSDSTSKPVDLVSIAKMIQSKASNTLPTVKPTSPSSVAPMANVGGKEAFQSMYSSV